MTSWSTCYHFTKGKDSLVTPGQQLPMFIYKDTKHFLHLCCCLPDVSSRPWRAEHIKLLSVVIGVVLHFCLQNLSRQVFRSTSMNWDNPTACWKYNSLYFTGFLKAALSYSCLVISSIHQSIWATVFLWNTRFVRDQNRRIWNRDPLCLERSSLWFLTCKLSIYIHLKCFCFLYTKNEFSIVGE